MNTSVHIPKNLSDRLKTYLYYNRIPKNRFLVEAIEHELERREEESAWHPDLISWEGAPEVEFDIELDRDFLLSAREDTL